MAVKISPKDRKPISETSGQGSTITVKSGNKKFPEVSYVKTPAKKVTSKADIEASNVLNQKTTSTPITKETGLNGSIVNVQMNKSVYGNYAVNNNPYSFHFRPSNQVDKGKGVFSVPSIGSQVWLFHYRGDYNFPVYIGGRTDRRVSSLIYNEDAPAGSRGREGTPGGINHSMDYPGVFENFPTTDDEIKRDTT